MYHSDKLVCRGCEKLLGQVNQRLGSWFSDLKARFINVHVKASHTYGVELFQIDEDGNPRVSRPFLNKIDKENKASRLKIVSDQFNWFRMKP